MEVSRFNGLVSKPMSVERGVACVVRMRKPLKRLNCAERGVSTGLKAGVMRRMLAPRCQTRYPDWHNDRANPFGFAQGSLLLEMSRDDQELASARFPMKKRRKPQCPPITSSPSMVPPLPAKAA